MKSSVIATDILKLVSSPVSLLSLMKSMISGWSTLSIAMLAPLRAPPCLMTSVAVLYIFMKDTGPLAMPPVERTMSDFGLR